MKTNCILALAGKMNHDLALELPVGHNVYALSQQYGDGIWYRAKVLRSRKVRGDRAYFVRFYGYPSCEDEWIDELDTIPVYKIEKGERVYACWMGDDDAQDYWFPGTIQGYKKNENGTKNLKGSRQYHVKFDDGDEDKRIDEIYVMPYDVYVYLATCDGLHKNKKSDKFCTTVETYNADFSANVQEPDSRDLHGSDRSSGKKRSIPVESDISHRSNNNLPSAFSAPACSCITTQCKEPMPKGSEPYFNETTLDHFKKKQFSDVEEIMSLQLPKKKKRLGSFSECNADLRSNTAIYALNEMNFVVC